MDCGRVAARDAFLRYVDSDEYGNGTFREFLVKDFAAQGVHNIAKLSGAKQTEASRGNQSFILHQRAEMRQRLVSAAMAGNLKHGAAVLAGFAESDTTVVINLNNFDEGDEEDE